MNFLYLNKEWKINCLASKCTRPTTRFHNCLGTAPHMQGSLNHLVIIVTWRMYFILSPRKCDYNLKNPYLRWRATLVAISPVGLIFWGKNQGPKCNGNQPEILLSVSLSADSRRGGCFQTLLDTMQLPGSREGSLPASSPGRWPLRWSHHILKNR